MPELLLELLSEEIPARMQDRAASDLETLLAAGLERAELGYETITTFVTPRRLAAIVRELPERQADLEVERRGPRVDAPQRAIDGFLGSLGADDYALDEQPDKKGAYLVARFVQRGRPTRDLLGPMIEELLGRFPWPKSMRWGANTVRWVRPLRGILCLLDGAVVPLRFGPVEAASATRGHRFMAPDAVEVRRGRDYVERLREARVVLDAGARRRIILERARALAEAEGLVLVDDPELLDELKGLVEWPAPLLGRIDERFMDLPSEVLVTSMRHHQKYLALREEDGALAPRFVAVANVEAADGGRAIVAGNERVLRARLWDADFFWRQDRKRPLASRVAALDSIVFHARLGTVGDKARRLEALARAIVRFVPGADPARAARAALLCKADLSTGMVGEFPELQGVMGRYYATHDGEDPEVAEAVAAHYAPQGPGDSCPTAPIAVTTALADKLDTLAGFFAAGLKPTGSKDPFALRRAAQGVIRLVLENRLRLPLLAVLGHAARGHAGVSAAGRQAAPAEVLDFLAERMKVHVRERGIRHDLVGAVFAVGRDDDLVRLLARIEALRAFLGTEDGANLLTAYRRASNIVRIEEKREGAGFGAEPRADLLEEPEERELFARLKTVGVEIDLALSGEEYGEAMAALANLRPPVDAFFERVRVNADAPALRRNRLSLLNRIRQALGSLADFTQIEDPTGSA